MNLKFRSWLHWPHFKCLRASCGLWLPYWMVQILNISINAECSIGTESSQTFMTTS